MSKPPFLATFLFAVGCFVFTSPAHAQVLQVEVTGLPPGATVDLVLVAANLNKTEQMTALSTGDAALALDFANLGKPQRAPQEQIQVFIVDCQDPKQVVRVVLVAEGGQVPLECGQQTGTQQRCNCRRGGAFILQDGTTGVRINVQTGVVQALTAGSALSTGGRTYRLIIGGGPEISQNGDIALSSDPPDDRFAPPHRDG